MKILITGAKGMLGSLLFSELSKSNAFEVIATDADELDITDVANVEVMLKKISPEITINCAAYTNVNDAEDIGKELNFRVNALGPKILAENCLKYKSRFIHISTDYVFGENKKNGYSESYEPKVDGALNEYGKAKREGELLSTKSNPHSIICRTSWIYGPNGKNFVDTMINLAKDRDELSIVTDEIGVPTYTLDVVNQLKYILQNIDDIEGGYYHIVNEGFCSRYEQAQKIFELAKIKVRLNKTKLSEFPRKAKVPNLSILKNTKLPKLRSWEDAITEYIRSLMLQINQNSTV